MDTAKIIARIQQLRAISKSTHSKAEAETTLAIAAKLIAEHQLSEAELSVKEGSNANDPIDLETESILYESGRKTEWKYTLALGLVELNGLFCYNAMVWGEKSHRKQTRLRIIGRKSDVEITLYMMQYLTTIIDELASMYTLPTGKPGVNPEKESWSLGCVLGFLDKMNAEKDAVMKTATSSALVFIGNKAAEAEKAFVAKTGMKLRSGGTYTPKGQLRGAAFGSGYQRGKTLSVNPGLNNNQSKPNQLYK